MERAKWTNAELPQPKPMDPKTFKPGDWVRHGPTKTWLQGEEILDLDGVPSVVGLGIRNEPVVAPVGECTRQWDPKIDVDAV